MTNASDQPDDQDVPIPFGYKASWIAVRAGDGKATAAALDLRDLERCTWRRGYQSIYRSNARDSGGVFVTPPVNGWIIAAGSLPSMDDRNFTEFFQTLSQRLGETFYFGTHRVVGYQAWARADKGVIRRAFGFLGESGEFLANSGNRTGEEVELNTGIEDLDQAPTEETVLALAAKWVLDPRQLHICTSSVGPGLSGRRR